MNKEIRIKTLEELINQPREIKFDTYEFDELSYTCLLCDIRMIILENQKYKEVIDKAITLINKYVEAQLEEDYLMNRVNLMNYNCNLLDILKEVK